MKNEFKETSYTYIQRVNNDLNLASQYLLQASTTTLKDSRFYLDKAEEFLGKAIEGINEARRSIKK